MVQYSAIVTTADQYKVWVSIDQRHFQ